MNNEEYNKIIQKHKILIDRAIEIMKTVDDLRHSLFHVESVVKYTMKILQYEEKANKEVCIISAYWHDVGRSIQSKGHSLISGDMLKEEMEKLKYDKEFIEQCYLAVYKHGHKAMPETLEGIIVRDADKIDFVGIDRWKIAIEKNKRFTQIIENMPILRNGILQLEISRKIYDREIVELVKYLHDVVFDNT